MKQPDEPIFDMDETTEGSSGVADRSVRGRIQHLVEQQPYAVLCVQGGGQPYGALVAFAFSEDLRNAVFVTPKATRKFRLLSECNHVALVIDNRPDKGDELMEIEAVTATGRSQWIERGPEFEHWAERLVTRHAYLEVLRERRDVCIVSRRRCSFLARGAISGGLPMDSECRLLIRLADLEQNDEKIVGGKAAKLGQLARAGFKVPNGFCLTTRAYEAFLRDANITTAIRMELGRKSMDEMRWEEIWDAALRIRAMFLAHPLSDRLHDAVAEGLSGLDSSTPLAVRSSAIGEDSAGRSFAGLHESIIGVRGTRAVEDAVRLVWASLWSDAALLYRKELGLDPARSRMAVLVQEMVDADRSGVAFARDPRDTRKRSRDHRVGSRSLQLTR